MTVQIVIETAVLQSGFVNQIQGLHGSGLNAGEAIRSVVASRPEIADEPGLGPSDAKELPVAVRAAFQVLQRSRGYSRAEEGITVAQIDT